MYVSAKNPGHKAAGFCIEPENVFAWIRCFTNRNVNYIQKSQPAQCRLAFGYWVGESNSYCEIENLEY